VKALTITCLLGFLAATVAPIDTRQANATGDVAMAGIRVAGAQLVTYDGQPVRLRGVNRSGAEFACIHEWGIFEGPTDIASAELIRSWNANAVRIGLNEDCWLGINGIQPAYSGETYRQAVIDYVNTLTADGLYAIVDLHWTAPGRARATLLRPMPDADHSLEFWRSVATTFVDNPNVLFDAFNEPFGVDWDCWRDGCIVNSAQDTPPWHAVGMQSLVDTIRATGARQPILLGGLWFANDLTEWRAHQPLDPLQQLVASVHVYPFNRCNEQSCWDDEIAPLADLVPVLVSEFGTDWTPPYSDAGALQFMDWADQHRIGYLAWTWNTWGGSGDALLASYTGEPTRWGAHLKAHLGAAAEPTP
jgi:endoglucanase